MADVYPASGTSARAATEDEVNKRIVTAVIISSIAAGITGAVIRHALDDTPAATTGTVDRYGADRNVTTPVTPVTPTTTPSTTGAGAGTGTTGTTGTPGTNPTLPSSPR